MFLFPKDLLPNSENLPQKKSLSCAFVDQNIYIFCHFQNFKNIATKKTRKKKKKALVIGGWETFIGLF
jgi:hypothetical protein